MQLGINLRQIFFYFWHIYRQSALRYPLQRTQYCYFLFVFYCGKIRLIFRSASVSCLVFGRLGQAVCKGAGSIF